MSAKLRVECENCGAFEFLTPDRLEAKKESHRLLRCESATFEVSEL